MGKFTWKKKKRKSKECDSAIKREQERESREGGESHKKKRTLNGGDKQDLGRKIVFFQSLEKGRGVFQL